MSGGEAPPRAADPLASLRARLVVAGADEAALERLARDCAHDPRAGARALGATCKRRLAGARAERARLARLFAHSRALHARGLRLVAGVDEVGVGPLAGPVVAAAVILPPGVELPGLDDSKRLAAPVRARLAQAVREAALAFGIGAATPAEVDAWNVYRASLEAMRRAVLALGVVPDHCLVDARRIPGLTCPQTPLVHGDAREGAIAAASVLAKVHRDSILCQLDGEWPGYGFAEHKGYPTPGHLEALRRLGPTPVHRVSFAPVAALRAPSPA